MKDTFWSGNKIQWFEWVMLMISFGVILETIRYTDVNLMNSGNPSGAGRQKELKATTFDKTQMAAPASWRQLAEEALLVEMTLKGDENRLSLPTTNRDWAAFGIPADEVAFFEFWQDSLDSTLLVDSDDRLDRLLEARELYRSVGEMMQQQLAQEAFFAKIENRYRIPTNRSRMHYLSKQPSTPGQWATFVAQHKGG
ncbi:MAG: hypothetical protein GC192_17525 [Bacteroidetes bacterium]|nr:hypothetical protein [Bacteroidota bacterium]